MNPYVLYRHLNFKRKCHGNMEAAIATLAMIDTRSAWRDAYCIYGYHGTYPTS
jgi:hypothetical protein